MVPGDSVTATTGAPPPVPEELLVEVVEAVDVAAPPAPPVVLDVAPMSPPEPVVPMKPDPEHPRRTAPPSPAHDVLPKRVRSKRSFLMAHGTPSGAPLLRSGSGGRATRRWAKA